MKRIITSFITLIGAVVLSISPAQSATVTISLVDPNADIGVPTATTTDGNVFQSVVGSISGVRQSPWEGTALENTGTYTSISGDSFASYVLDSGITSFTFMWGSVEIFNTIQFFNNGLSTGELIVGQNGIDAGAPAMIGFGVATIITDNEFDEVRFLSGQNSFEFANLNFSAVVPVPAGVWLFSSGLIGLIGVARRKKV